MGMVVFSNNGMANTTLIFLSWTELWKFHRSVATNTCTIMFKEIELTGDFSDNEINFALRAMHATIKGTTIKHRQ
jgi:hypothetical protein